MKNLRSLRFAAGFLGFCLIFSFVCLFPAHLTGGLEIKNDFEGTFAGEVSAAGGVTVIIDPGHGGEDGGASGYGGLYEKELNLLISRNLRDMLVFGGVSVIMTRDEDVLLYDHSRDSTGSKKSQDLSNRLKLANGTENSLLLSIHMNAFPQEKYKGLQVYYSVADERSKALAETIQSCARETLDAGNERKPKAAGKNIYLLDRLRGVGVLVECGFLSNSEERARLNTEEYRASVAAVLFASVMKYLGTG